MFRCLTLCLVALCATLAAEVSPAYPPVWFLDPDRVLLPVDLATPTFLEALEESDVTVQTINDNERLCQFCEPSLTPTSQLIWQGQTVKVYLLNNPFQAGEVLVTPIRHLANLQDLNDAEVLELHRALTAMGKVYEKVLQTQGYQVFMRNRPINRNEAQHLTFHLLPAPLYDGPHTGSILHKIKTHSYMFFDSKGVDSYIDATANLLAPLSEALAETIKTLELPENVENEPFTPWPINRIDFESSRDFLLTGLYHELRQHNAIAFDLPLDNYPRKEPSDSLAIDSSASTVPTCLFCSQRILNRQTIIEGDSCRILINFRPYTMGFHLLAIPKRHVERNENLNTSEVLERHRMLVAISQVMTHIFGQKDFVLFIQDGRNAGQTVPHTHIHCVATPSRLDHYSHLIVELSKLEWATLNSKRLKQAIAAWRAPLEIELGR